MRVALTGATGFIGSHVLTELDEHGHEVTALVRDDGQADIVATRGAAHPVVDLYDRPAVCSLRTMPTGPSTLPAPATRPALIRTRRWSTRRSRHSAAPASPISTSRGRGSTGPTPTSARSPRSMRPRWSPGRSRSLRQALDATDMRGVVIAPGVAYGDGGGGVPGLLLGLTRDDGGNLIMLGTGDQHWATVHVADLADFFRRALRGRLGPRALRRRRWTEPDRCGVDRGCRRRGRRPRRGPVPTTRLGPAWATTSPRCCCSIRAPTRPGPRPSSVGGPATPD